jgi:hypothetical protein
MLIKSRWRRPTAAVLVVAGGLMIYLTPELRPGGLLLLGLGVLIEIMGITLSH